MRREIGVREEQERKRRENREPRQLDLERSCEQETRASPEAKRLHSQSAWIILEREAWGKRSQGPGLQRLGAGEGARRSHRS